MYRISFSFFIPLQLHSTYAIFFFSFSFPPCELSFNLFVEKIVVVTYTKTNIDTVLPAVQEGIFDPDWRIRQSSVQLLGDLLYCIAETRVKKEEEEEERYDSKNS